MSLASHQGASVYTLIITDANQASWASIILNLVPSMTPDAANEFQLGKGPSFCVVFMAEIRHNLIIIDIVDHFVTWETMSAEPPTVQRALDEYLLSIIPDVCEVVQVRE